MNVPNPPDRSVARPGNWPVSLGLLAVAGMAAAWRVLQASQGVDLFSDDAYYYAIIARNFVETGRFTFDGLSLTNGFHPLLFWVETAGFAVFGTAASPGAQYLGILAGVTAVFLLTVGGCLWAVHARARSEDDAVIQTALWITLCVILVPRFTVPFLGGMEAILVLPLFLLLGILAWRSQYAAAGIGALLLVMARLDMLPYVVLPIGLACAWRERSEGRSAIRSGLLVVLPAVIGTSLLMLWHLWYFGEPVPIHGVLKSCFPRINFRWHEVVGGPFGLSTLRIAILSAAAGAGLLLRGGKIGKEVRGAGLTAAALGLVQLAAFMMFQKWSKPIPVWYLGPAVLAGAFALAVGIANTVGLRRLRTVAMTAGVAVVAINLASLGRAWQRGGPPWAIARTPPGKAADGPASVVDFIKMQPRHQTWACTDCGKLAFWGDRTIVNLDGLVNDFRYQDDLRDGRLAQHLLKKNVKYLICTAWDRSQTDRGEYEPMYRCRVAPDLFSGDYETAEFFVYSYKYMKYSDTIRLPREAEVWRSAAGRDGRAMARTIVFDLDVALRGDATAATDRLAARANAARPW